MGTFATDQSPFQEYIDTTKFFSGGNRRETLELLKSAITESVSLITLTGDEGCGKSLMCRMVEKEMPEGYVLLFFDEMLESFEDVTRAIAQKMKITLADGIAVSDIRELLFEVLERLSEGNQKMLLIFDQAEKIYLATLERIRKMLDVVNQTGINFQIIFAGGEHLLDNLAQLSMCNFQGAEERQFVLGPLDSAATHDYLNFCMQQEEGNEVFSPEVSEKIFNIAGGNIRKTNMLAEDSLQSLTPDSSFMVLLDNVRDTLDEEEPARWNLSFLLKKYQSHKKWVISAGISLVVLGLILALRMGESRKVDHQKPASEVQKLSTEFQNLQKKEEAIERRAKEAAMKQSSSSEHTPVAEKQPSAQKSEQTGTASSSLKVESMTVKKSAEAKTVETPPVAATPASKEAVSQEKPAAEPQVLSEEEQKKQVEKIFNERTAAAAKWLIGQKNNHYTIQLMVLASDGAEKNLKRMLAQKEYQEVADKLFILRKVTSTPSIVVFFGEYATMVDARKARNALPEFLLKHNPYAISIRGAIEKAIGS